MAHRQRPPPHRHTWASTRGRRQQHAQRRPAARDVHLNFGDAPVPLVLSDGTITTEQRRGECPPLDERYYDHSITSRGRSRPRGLPVSSSYHEDRHHGRDCQCFISSLHARIEKTTHDRQQQREIDGGLQPPTVVAAGVAAASLGARRSRLRERCSRCSGWVTEPNSDRTGNRIRIPWFAAARSCGAILFRRNKRTRADHSGGQSGRETATRPCRRATRKRDGGGA